MLSVGWRSFCFLVLFSSSDFHLFPMSPKQYHISNYIQAKMGIKIPDKALENSVHRKETLSSEISRLSRPRWISHEGERGKGENIELNFRIKLPVWCRFFILHQLLQLLV